MRFPLNFFNRSEEDPLLASELAYTLAEGEGREAPAARAEADEGDELGAPSGPRRSRPAAGLFSDAPPTPPRARGADSVFAPSVEGRAGAGVDSVFGGPALSGTPAVEGIPIDKLFSALASVPDDPGTGAQHLALIVQQDGRMRGAADVQRMLQRGWRVHQMAAAGPATGPAPSAVLVVLEYQGS